MGLWLGDGLHLALELLVVVVTVGIGRVSSLLGDLLQEGIATVVIAASMNLEAGLLVVVAREDFLESDDTGDGEGDLADDQSLSGDEGQSLESQRTGDSHSGEHGGDDVFVLLLALTASLRQVNLHGVRLQELLDVLDQGSVDFTKSA